MEHDIVNDQYEHSQSTSEREQDTCCLLAVIEKLTTSKLSTLFEALENLDKAMFEVMWEGLQSDGCLRKISQERRTIYRIKQAMQRKARENNLSIPVKELDKEQIRNLESWRLAELSDALGDAYSAVTEIIYSHFESSLYPTNLIQARRGIAETLQICENIRTAKLKPFENQNENETMNDLHKYLRNLSQPSCKAFHKSLENALILISREIQCAEGMGFEWVGQLTVAANIIEDALNVAEAFTDEK